MIPGLGRLPGEGKGYPLQYSGLKNSMDCIVHRVTKSWTRLREYHFTGLLSCFSFRMMLCQRQYEEERPGLKQKARNLTLTCLVDCAVNHLFNFYLLRVRLKSKQPLLAVFLEINLSPGCLTRGPPSVCLSGPSLPVPTLFSPPLSPHLALHSSGRDPEGCGISRHSPPT